MCLVIERQNTTPCKFVTLDTYSLLFQFFQTGCFTSAYKQARGMTVMRPSYHLCYLSNCCETGVALLTTSDASPNYGDGLCVLSALLFGVHKWRSETATVRFVENTQELVAIQLGTLAVLANIFELPKYLELSHYSPGMS